MCHCDGKTTKYFVLGAHQGDPISACLFILTSDILFLLIKPKPEIAGLIEAVAQRCSLKKVFLEISQNSQENTCARVPFVIKLQAPLI